MECPECGTEMEKVEVEVSRATPEKDSEWGEWLECPNCHHQEDIEPDEPDYEPEFEDITTVSPDADITVTYKE